RRICRPHIALLHCRKGLFAIVRIKNLDRLPLAVRGETRVHFVDHCVDSVPVISIDAQVRARRNEKREEANVAAQVGSQLQKASESTEADDLVLAWIESIRANNRLLSFVAAPSRLPARPRGQPLARSRDRWRLHRFLHLVGIGARGKGAHSNEPSIPRCDSSVLVIDLRTEQFFAAPAEWSRSPVGLHAPP